MISARRISLIIRFVFVAFLLISISACQQFYLQNADAISVPVNEKIADDEHINDIIKPYQDSLSLTMNQIIGFSSMEMRKGFPEGLLGNFVTKLMVDMTQNQLNKEVDFAFTNNGGLRTVLPKGDIFLRSIYELMPFENEIIILELDHSHLMEFFSYISKNGGIAVSGLRLEIENKKVVRATINGEQINDQKIYKVVTIDYLANGGSGMSFLEDVTSRELVGIRLRDMIINYIKLKQSINEELRVSLDERIKINE